MTTELHVVGEFEVDGKPVYALCKFMGELTWIPMDRDGPKMKGLPGQIVRVSLYADDVGVLEQHTRLTDDQQVWRTTWR